MHSVSYSVSHLQPTFINPSSLSFLLSPLFFALFIIIPSFIKITTIILLLFLSFQTIITLSFHRITIYYLSILDPSIYHHNPSVYRISSLPPLSHPTLLIVLLLLFLFFHQSLVDQSINEPINQLVD